MTKILLLALALALAVVWPAHAQTSPGPYSLTGTTGAAACTPFLNVTDRGSAAVEIDISGTYTLEFQGSISGQSFSAITATDAGDTTPSPVTSTTADGKFFINVGGLRQVRVCGTSGSGSAVVYMGSSASGGGSSGGAPVTLEGDVTVGAQPADAPHHVLGSDGSTPFSLASETTLADVKAAVEALAGIISMGALPVSGDFTTDGLTDAELRATAVPVSLASVPSHPVTNAGTFAVQAAQSGTWNLTNISGTVSLPTGAATATNQSTAITALQLLDNPVGSATGGTAGTSSFLAGGLYNSTPPTLTTGQQVAFQFDINGNLKTSGGGSGGTALADDADFTAGTTPFTPIGGFHQSSVTACTDGDTCAVGITAGRAAKVAVANADGTLMTPDTQAVFGGAITVTAGSAPTGGFGAWCRASAAAPSTTGVADNDAVLPWCQPTGAVMVMPDPAGQDTQAVFDGAIILSTGVGPTGGFLFGRASGSAPTDITSDDNAQVLWLTPKGALNIADAGGSITVDANNLDVQSGGADLATAAQLSTTNGHLSTLATYLQPGSVTIMRSDNTDNDDETQIKSGAGVLLAISGRNASADTDAYVRCINNLAASVTPGSTSIDVYELMLPFGGGWVNGTIGPAGIAFSTGLTCYVATGKAASDATDAAQDDVVVNVVWR